MFSKLRSIFFGPAPNPPTAEPSRIPKPEVPVAPGAPERYLLLSRRFSQLPREFEGFREVYYCTRCDDYFAMAWRLKSSPPWPDCEVIPPSHPCLRGTDTLRLEVFCPQCQMDHSVYGSIQLPDGEPEDAQPTQVYQASDYPLPPDVPSTAGGTIKIGNLIVEKVVLFVSGQVPEGLDMRDFAYSGFNEMILSRHRHEKLEVSGHGGVRLHLVRVSHIVDETNWITPLLQREVYRTEYWTPKIFLSYAVVNLRPPLGQAMFCLVLPSD